MKQTRTAALLALYAMSTSGCFLWTTRGEGNDMASRLDAQQRRITDLEHGASTDREQLRAALAQATQQVHDLQALIDQATAQVTRNSADTGQRVETLETQLNQANGHIDELQHALDEMTRTLAAQQTEVAQRMDALARRAGVDMPVDASQIPADKADHYAAAYRAYQASNYSLARALFREYIVRYAQDDNADNAQYWIGASYLQEHHPATALGELQKVINQYATGDAVDEALFAMAESFYELHACTDARGALDALIRGHPQSTLLRNAQERKRQMEHAPRGYCTS